MPARCCATNRFRNSASESTVRKKKGNRISARKDPSTSAPYVLAAKPHASQRSRRQLLVSWFASVFPFYHFSNFGTPRW
ncbi:hypothetical protein M440DRAFT_1236293 [Trichoderma longibrachiatum ATCC 18648]|uniref:Uncharacterized protein n=1 Tax=Trichoderma longibrachiatum ATCC 18648 TaxID=983965 RepID=A0A2T4C5J9_TRILO|nr:hypothetical protein M440DRAFT_1236293 [Trichoderma longibrachiatum ATCC 18648]